MFVNVLKPYTTLLTWSGIASIAIYLFHLNQLRLKAIAHSTNKKSLPISIVKHNLVTIVFTFLFILVISCISIIKSGFLWVWNIIGTGLSMLIIWFFSLFKYRVTQQTPGGITPETDSATVSPVMNVIIAILVGLFFIIVFWLIYVSLKNLPKFTFRKWHRDVTPSYEDEEESLYTFDNIKKTFANRVRKGIFKVSPNEPKWKDLKNNKERIRYIYTKAIKKSIASGYLFKAHFTPSETAKDIDEWQKEKLFEETKLAVLYSDVRYENMDVEDNVVDNVRKNFEDKIK